MPSGLLPSNTRAILVSVTCDQWKEAFGANMSLRMKQKGQKSTGETVLSAPMNDFFYEVMVPWDGQLANEVNLVVAGSSKNIYTLNITGYITG